MLSLKHSFAFALAASLAGFVAAAGVITDCKPGYVALTFDDGPFKYTDKLLDILKENGVKATFFVNGENFWNIEQGRSVIQRAFNEEHQIASHTWSHPDLTTISGEDFSREVDQLEDAINSIIGRRPAFLRPPFGSYNDEVLSELDSRGYSTVIWSTDTKDYESHDLTQERERVRESYSSKDIDRGFIVLAHDVHEQTVNELALDLIQYTKAQGFQFATVAECVGSSPYK